jgi:hypothetical protein
MNEQEFEHAGNAPVDQQACAFLRHRSPRGIFLRPRENNTSISRQR